LLFTLKKKHLGLRSGRTCSPFYGNFANSFNQKMFYKLDDLPASSALLR